MNAMTGAAVIAGLARVSQPTMSLLASIVGRMVNPSVDGVGEGLDALQEWARQRGEHATQILVGAAATLEKKNVEPLAVPGRILVPILGQGSLEDDAELRDVWSRLLATAANPTTAHTVMTSFPHILGQLSPVEMRMLHFVDSQGVEKSGYHAFKIADVSAYFQVHQTVTLIHRDNLQRLGLIAPTFAATAPGNEAGEPYTGPLYLTSLGYAFVHACTAG